MPSAQNSNTNQCLSKNQTAPKLYKERKVTITNKSKTSTQNERPKYRSISNTMANGPAQPERKNKTKNV